MVQDAPKCELAWNEEGEFEILCESAEDQDQAFRALEKKPDIVVRVKPRKE